MEKGFTLYYRGQDCFFRSDSQRITKTLTRKIIRALTIVPSHMEIPDALITRVQRDIRKATYEVKETSQGRKYCNISGDDFGYGDFLDNYEHEHHYVID